MVLPYNISVAVSSTGIKFKNNKFPCKANNAKMANCNREQFKNKAMNLYTIYTGRTKSAISLKSKR